MGRTGRIVVAACVVAAGAALGVVLGLASLMVHREALRVSGVPLPWGLLLGLGTTYSVVTGLSLTAAGVRGSAGCGAGWLLLVLAAQRTRPEGDFLVAGDGLGLGFVLGGMVVVAAAVVRSGTRRSPAVRGGHEEVRP